MSPAPRPGNSPGPGMLVAGLLFLGGLFPGLALGGYALRHFNSLGERGPGASAGESGAPAQGGAVPLAEASERRAKAPLPPVTGTLLEALQAEAAQMSQAERLEELRTLLTHRPSFADIYGGNHQMQTAEQQLRFSALIRPEDLPHMPALMDEVLGGSGRSGHANTSRTYCLATWQGLDPDGFAQWAEQKLVAGDPENRFQLPINMLAQDWAKRYSPLEAWQHAEQLLRRIPPGRANSQYWFSSIVSRLATDDPMEAFRRGSQLENRQLRNQARSLALNQLAAKDFRQAIQLLETEFEVAPAHSRHQYAGILNSYSHGGAAQCQELLAWLQGPGRAHAEQHSIDMVIHNWSAHDREGMLKWFEANQAWMAEHKVEAPRQHGVRSRQYKTLDEEMTAARAMEAGQERQQALQTAYSRLADVRPDEALRGLATLEGGDESTKVAQAVLGQVSQYDPEKAARSLPTLPTKTQEEAIGNVVSRWVAVDPAAASTWLDKLPEGPAKDMGRYSLVNAIVNTDPEAAVVWSQQIQDKSRQDSSLRSALRRWGKQDRTAARAWMEAQASSMEEEQLARLRKLLE